MPYINKFFVASILRSTSLVFEDNIIIPPTLYIVVLGVKQWISSGDIKFTLILFLDIFFLFLNSPV